MSRCLTRSEISKLVSADDASPSQGEWRSHLEGCERCRRAARDERLFLDVRLALADQNQVVEQRAARNDGNPHPAPSPSRAEIPGYQIESEIHRGGQGVVYRARQIATNRLVALKVLSTKRQGSERDRQRFDREIDIVAGLQHPNIATLYESGSHEGTHFIAMELIEGESLDQWIARHARSRPIGQSPDIQETLTIFAQVCDGVAYAHRRGIVHRDLKPENILLDEDQVPHIIDFGLAKLTHRDSLEAASLQTQGGEFLGTVAYASPEQVTGHSDQIDIRSDVYSLGVVLFEMLTHRLPYDTDHTLLETLRHIREVEPTRPSSLCSYIDDELETILLKALAKPPERRYDSAASLASDLRRYAQGRPIEAKRDSTWYLARKLVRRHRWLVATAGAFLAVICAGLVVSVWLWRQAARERDVARAAQQAASVARQNETRLRTKAEIASAHARYQAFVANIAAAELALRQSDVADSWNRLKQIPKTLRRFEWFHLASQLDHSIRRFDGHAAYVEDVACFHYKPLAVSASWDKTVRIWNLNTGEVVHKIELPHHAWSVAISSNDRLLAIGDWNGTVHLVDAATFVTGQTFQQPNTHVTSLAFAPHEEKLAVAYVSASSTSPSTNMQLIDCRSEQVVSQWNQPGYAHSLEFDASSERLAIALADEIVVRDVSSGKTLRSLVGSRTATFNATGTRIAYATRRDALKIESWSDQHTELELKGHTGIIYQVVFSDDDSRVITASRDKTIRVWDATTGELIRRYLGHSWTVTSVAVTPDNRHLVSGSWDQTLRLWSLKQHSTAFRSLQAHSQPVLGLAVSPDGTKIATASFDHSAKIWDLVTGKLLHKLDGHAGPVQDVAFSPDGAKIATASWDRSVRVWDAEAAGKPKQLEGHTDRAHAVVFSDDGEHLYSGSADDRICLWNLSDGSLSRRIHAHDDHIHRLTLNPGTNLLISAGHRSVKFWNAQSFEPQALIRRQILERDFTLAVHPSGQSVAAGSHGHQIVLWDIKTRRPRTTFVGHTDETLSLCFNPTGDRLVSSSLDGTVRIWDVPHGTLLIKLDTAGHLVQAVAFTPNGRSIVGGTDRGEILIWSQGYTARSDESEQTDTSQPAVAGP